MRMDAHPMRIGRCIRMANPSTSHLGWKKLKMIFDQVVRLLLHGLENSQSNAVKAKIREEVSIREKTIKGIF